MTRWQRAVERWLNPRDRVLAAMPLHAGLRMGETVALDLDDIRLSARKGLIIVRSGKGDRYRRARPGCGRGARSDNAASVDRGRLSVVTEPMHNEIDRSHRSGREHEQQTTPHHNRRRQHAAPEDDQQPPNQAEHVATFTVDTTDKDDDRLPDPQRLLTEGASGKPRKEY